MTKRSFRIDFNNNTIVMTKAFAQKAANPATDEYDELMKIRKDFEGFKLEIRESAKKKNSLKGLDYGFMEQYIARHDYEENSKMAEFKKLTVKNYDMLTANRYGRVRKWFLEQYPEFCEAA